MIKALTSSSPVTLTAVSGEFLLEQGLYAPDQGIFPDFTNGERSYGGTVQIVSRGLAKPPRMIFIPRIFNRPELSVIDIVPAEQ